MTKKYDNFMNKILTKEMDIIDNYFVYQGYLLSKRYNKQPQKLTLKDFNLTKKKIEFVEKLYTTADIMDNIMELNPRAVTDYIYTKKEVMYHYILRSIMNENKYINFVNKIANDYYQKHITKSKEKCIFYAPTELLVDYLSKEYSNIIVINGLYHNITHFFNAHLRSRVQVSPFILYKLKKEKKNKN